MASNIEDVVRRGIDLYVRYYGELSRLYVDYLRDLSAVLNDLRRPVVTGAGETGEPAGRQAHPTARVLVLEAAAGETASGEFLITNHVRTVVSTRVATTPFVDSDGHQADLRFTFEPEEVDLRPGERVLVRAALAVDERMRPAVSYRGEFTIPDLDGAAIPVIVRRRRDRE